LAPIPTNRFLAAPTLDDVAARRILVGIEILHLDRSYDSGRARLPVLSVASPT
jgi:hypothetical protein